MTKNNLTLSNTLQHWLMYPVWMLGLAITMMIGLAAGIAVPGEGLEPHRLTDNIPWGLWIALDLSSIAISAGAFKLVGGSLHFGDQETAPHRACGGVRRADRLLDGAAGIAARHRPTGSLLALHSVLEHALGIVGSDDVYHALL